MQVMVNAVPPVTTPVQSGLNGSIVGDTEPTHKEQNLVKYTHQW